MRRNLLYLLHLCDWLINCYQFFRYAKFLSYLFPCHIKRVYCLDLVSETRRVVMNANYLKYIIYLLSHGYYGENIPVSFHVTTVNAHVNTTDVSTQNTRYIYEVLTSDGNSTLTRDGLSILGYKKCILQYETSRSSLIAYYNIGLDATKFFQTYYATLNDLNLNPRDVLKLMILCNCINPNQLLKCIDHKNITLTLLDINNCVEYSFKEFDNIRIRGHDEGNRS